jgi:hypothetical protein
MTEAADPCCDSWGSVECVAGDTWVQAASPSPPVAAVASCWANVPGDPGGDGGGGGVVGGAQQRGTEGEQPLEMDLAEVESVASSTAWGRLHRASGRRATRRPSSDLEGGLRRLVPTGHGGRGQAAARWPSRQQLRHRVGYTQSALI